MNNEKPVNNLLGRGAGGTLGWWQEEVEGEPQRPFSAQVPPFPAPQLTPFTSPCSLCFEGVAGRERKRDLK